MKFFIDKTLPSMGGIFERSDNEVLYFDKTSEQMHTDVDVVICRAHTPINEHFFNGKIAKVVATATSGSEHLDKAWLASKNITWIDALGANANSVCDYVLHIIHHSHTPLIGKKIGIVGVGHVGSRVDAAMQALNYQTVLYDPPRAKKEPHFISCQFEDLFECDIISLHLPLTYEGPYKTFDLINDPFLSRCKPGCLIINTSRGEVLSEKGILNNKQLIFSLDVFQSEPEIKPTIIERCLFSTPHIAGHAIEGKQRAMMLLFNKIQTFFKLPHQSTPYDHLLSKEAPLLKHPLVLSYDPHIETAQLKKTPTSDMFLKLRKAHIHRHELSQQCT